MEEQNRAKINSNLFGDHFTQPLETVSIPLTTDKAPYKLKKDLLKEKKIQKIA